MTKQYVPFQSTREGKTKLKAALRRAASIYKPPPTLTVSEWADQYRKLSAEDSAERGQWITARAEYQREFMDAVNDPMVETVVAMWAAQTGKSQCLLNALGYYMDQDASPVLFLQPTLEMAEAFSKDRLAPMLRDTPKLHGKVKDPRSRDSGNTLLHKSFAGGHITLAGANSPASLASRPIRIFIADEVDRFPTSAGSEGDPISLGAKRTTTFWNRKRIYVSTPTIKGASRIESLYEASSKGKYHVPCPHCQTMQVLKWGQVHWPKTAEGVAQPEFTIYVCEACAAEITEADKSEMVRQGKWVHEHPEKSIRGFWVNELYSPWVSWAEMVANFLLAKKHTETLKTFINTSLAETWEQEGESVDDGTLFGRREDYNTEEIVKKYQDGQIWMPPKAVLITAGVDTQDDRVEMEVVGWGPGEESWSIEFITIRGNPALPEVWNELDRHLLKRYPHESGFLPIAAAVVDSGGHHTKQVYDFCKRRQMRRIWAGKGQAGPGKPITGRPSKGNKAGVPLFPIGVDTAKEILYDRLRLDQFGPGYCHFPKRMEYDEEYFKQLTAEKLRTKFLKGFPVKYWEKTRARNEALDMRVYALAALDGLKVNLDMRAEQLAKRTDEAKAVPPPQMKNVGAPDPKPQPPKTPGVRPRPTRRPGGSIWVNAWRG
jgi:phage terminase large subunit GpA-like protein